MEAWVRAIAVLGVAGAVSGLAVGQLAIGQMPTEEVPEFAFGTDEFHSYNLSSLEILEHTVFQVDEKYVDASRLDWQKMYVEVLLAIEAEAPSTVFHLGERAATDADDGGLVVSVEIGDYRTLLEVEAITDQGALLRRVRQITDLLIQHLKEEDLPQYDNDFEPFRNLEYAMTRGMLAGVLDPHTDLLPPEAAEEMDVENRGEYAGVGITVTEDRNRLVIRKVHSNTPAESAGLLDQDIIIRIDGQSTVNMLVGEAQELLMGPVGAPVSLTVARKGSDEPVKVQLNRAIVALKAVRGELLDGGIAYVLLEGFHSQLSVQLHDRLNQLGRENGGELRGVILDMRDNPGGYYHQGVAVADYFLDEGVIVSTVDRDGMQVDSKRAHREGAHTEYPVAVLMNAGSASASEIVAGALRNHDRALIIGERSFGKGSVQTLHEYPDGAKLKLTVSRYLTPGDRSIQAVGIPADIELNAVVVDPDAQHHSGVSLFARAHRTREADLPGALGTDVMDHETPAYSLRYQRPPRGQEFRAERDLNTDYEVQFARDVLMAAPSPLRTDVLAAASTVVRRHRQRNDAQIGKTMAALGLDWRDGTAWRGDEIPLQLQLDVGEGLVAGSRRPVTLTVTNTSDKPLFRVSAVASEHEVLDGWEFPVGYLPPGASRSWTADVYTPVGYPAERAPVTLEVFDRGDSPVVVERRDIDVKPRALPKIDWQWVLSDQTGGDGDGVVQVGENIEITLTLHNTGDGPSTESFALIRNNSGKSLDIARGNLYPGYWRDRQGKDCKPPEPVAETEPLERGDTDCFRQIAAGESWTGTFSVDVRAAADKDEALSLQLELGDLQAFDWGAVARTYLLQTRYQEETIPLDVGYALRTEPLRQSPLVNITHRPKATVQGGRVTVSGVATDDVGLAHVMIYAGEDKVFHQGAGEDDGLTSIPFTADVVVEDGLNTVTVVAVDVDGFTHTQSVSVWSAQPELAQGITSSAAP